MAEDNTPTNVVDDFKLSGTMGGNTTPTGVNIAYAKVEDLEQFIQFDRKAEGNVERINEIKKTILDKGYLYDTSYEGGVVFGVIIDEAGNVQIPEGNHRLQALIDVAKETGQEIYVPINPMLTSTGGGNKVQLTNSDNAYKSMKQLLTDMLERNKNFNVERTISEKLGEPGTRIIGLESYTYPGGAPGTSTTQSNIKKFFNSIGLNTITYDELPDNNIYKTGVNTFTDTPTNVVDDKLKRINEILKEGIEATGIDADPSANNYATDYPTEHGDLIRELEDIGTLDELQDLVGGEKKLENLITDIVNKQEEVSPRYLKSTPPLNEYGEEFGARGAYGITTEELLQTEIQDVIKQNLGIDTPTNVVDDVSKLQNNINDYLNEIILDNPLRSADLAVDPLTLTLSDDGKFIDITEFVIDENYRNQGLGTEVFNRIKEFANNNNLSITTTPFVGELEDLVKKEGFVKEGNQYILKPDTPTNVVGNEFVDNILNANTQLVNNLPLSETVKNQFDNVVRNRAKNLATPGGVIDAVDVWEMGVLGLMIAAIAYKEYDEIPTIFKRTATNMFNSMTSMYNIPPVPLEQYDLDYEFIEKVITTGEKVMPTDIIIKKVGEIAKGVGEKGLATGFGYVPTTPKNTDTMETTQKIQPGVQEEKMFEQLKPKKIKSAGGAGAKIL